MGLIAKLRQVADKSDRRLLSYMSGSIKNFRRWNLTEGIYAIGSMFAMVLLGVIIGYMGVSTDLPITALLWPFFGVIAISWAIATVMTWCWLPWLRRRKTNVAE